MASPPETRALVERAAADAGQVPAERHRHVLRRESWPAHGLSEQVEAGP
ncbi:MAG: hypothetical protein OYK82_01565 [Gammaproteobacteria bacterium]|nr:hypothetical protein [Gammaproteobacteria bacterium]